MKALILGGENSFVRDNLSEKLSDFDIEVVSIWHWDHSKPISKIPQGCDTVIVLKDMTGHPQRNVVRQLAKRQGLTFIEIPRKWAVAQKHLQRLGLPSKSGVVDTPTSFEGEDFNVTLARVIEMSCEMYKADSTSRPNPQKVADALNIPTWHHALQRGISAGVLRASNETNEVVDIDNLNGDGWSLSEMVGMYLNDYPEAVLKINELCMWLADTLSRKNNKSFKTQVKRFVTSTKKKWVRCSRKAGTHADRIYIDGLKFKWLEELSREHYDQWGTFPKLSEIRDRGKDIFGSTYSQRLHTKVIESLQNELAEVSDPVSEENVRPVSDEHAIDLEPPTLTPIKEETVETEKTTKSKKQRPRKLKSSLLRESIAKHFNLLGKVRDSEVARMVGCSADSVRRYRMEFGVACMSKNPSDTPPPGLGPYERAEVELQTQIEKAKQPVLEIKTFDTSSQRPAPNTEQFVPNTDQVVLHLLQNLNDALARIDALETKVAELESSSGTVKVRAEGSLGAKVDDLLESGFSVKLEVTQ